MNTNNTPQVMRDMIDKMKNFNYTNSDTPTKPLEFYIMNDFTSMKDAMNFARSLGEIESINDWDNHSGYANLKAEQYIIKYTDGTYSKVGGEFITSKGKNVYFVKTYDENKNHFNPKYGKSTLK